MDDELELDRELTAEEQAYAHRQTDPIQREFLAAIQRHYPVIGHQLVIAGLVETLATAMQAVLRVEPHRRRLFLSHLDALRLMIETTGDETH